MISAGAHRMISVRAVVMAAVAGAAACAGESTGRAGDEGPAERPATIVDTLHLEGTAEPVELRLVPSPAHFPLPFTTYAPPAIEVADADRGDQAEVRFVADFDGRDLELAWLEIAAYPDGLGEEEAKERARRAAGDSARPVSADEPIAPWVIGAWRVAALESEDRTGLVLLGRHDGRYFHIRQVHPPEFGDGFGPRVALILRHWQWSDGSPLRAESPAMAR